MSGISYIVTIRRQKLIKLLSYIQVYCDITGLRISSEYTGYLSYVCSFLSKMLVTLIICLKLYVATMWKIAYEITAIIHNNKILTSTILKANYSYFQALTCLTLCLHYDW